jgi:hypothetical protein
MTGVAVLLARGWFRDRPLRAEGALVQAQLEGRETRGGRGGVSYLVHYRFETPGGQTVRGSSCVSGGSRGEWERAGPTLPVR